MKMKGSTMLDIGDIHFAKLIFLLSLHKYVYMGVYISSRLSQ